MSGYVTLDSGDREEFATGSVRDVREGKGRYDLIPPHPLERLAGVYERGAAKYGDRNWELGQPVSRFLDSAIRHSFRHLEGHRDEDHLAQAAWNLFAAMHVEEMVARGLLPTELDDLVSHLPRRAASADLAHRLVNAVKPRVVGQNEGGFSDACRFPHCGCHGTCVEDEGLAS